MNFKIACLFLALASFSISAGAEVVRCTGPDGKVSYSDYKCPTTTTNNNIKAVNTGNMQSPGAAPEYQAPIAQQNGRARNVNATINININVNEQNVVATRRRVVYVHEQGRSQSPQSSTSTSTAASPGRAAATASHGAAHK